MLTFLYLPLPTRIEAPEGQALDGLGPHSILQYRAWPVDDQ